MPEPELLHQQRQILRRLREATARLAEIGEEQALRSAATRLT